MRTNKMIKRMQLIANIASLITCLIVTGIALLIGVALVRNNYMTNTSRSSQSPLSVGEKVRMLDLDWAASDQTLLLALNKGCGFCRASAPFYQKLANAMAGRKSVRLVAVLPQAIDESQQYLNELGVPIHEIKQAQLSALGVRGTPTLILVNKAGVITDTWIGELTPAQE